MNTPVVNVKPLATGYCAKLHSFRTADSRDPCDPMVILQHSPDGEDLLDFIDQSIRNLAESGADARYILLGIDAFALFRQAVARKLSRKPRDFGTYESIPVILDPFRAGECCVLPEPRALHDGVQAVTLPPGG